MKTIFFSSGIVPHRNRFDLKTLVNISCGKGFFGVIIKKILFGLLGLSRATRDVAPRLSDIPFNWNECTIQQLRDRPNTGS